MDARVGGRGAGMRYIGKAALLAGVSSGALAIACLMPAPASAATYFVSNQTELANAIAAANGNADPNSTIVMTQSFAVLGTTDLPTPTKDLTIDTNGFVLSGTPVGPGTPGSVNFQWPVSGGTLTVTGTLQGSAQGAIGPGVGLVVDTGVGITAQIINNGSITGGAATTTGRGSLGVSFLDPTIVFTNNGTISGGFGISTGPTNNGAGINMFNGGTVTNNATGTIQGGNGQGTGSAGAGVYMRNLGAPATLTNFGTVRGGSVATGTGNAAVLIQGTAGNIASITNSGTIEGGNGAAAIATQAATANIRIVNSGTIRAGAGFATAIQFGTSGTSVASLELQAGSQIVGNVVASALGANDTLRLGGAANASFDVSAIGPAAQYQNFDSFEKTGSGTWSLTGAGTATTNWQINQGTLQIGNGGTGGSVVGSLTTASAGTLAFNRSDAFTFGNLVLGNGTIRQIGSGTTILTANNSAFAGNTSVEAGTLSVSGALGGTMAVLGGRLQGTGTVGATTVAAGGTIAPGNSIGTLTVNGNLVLAPGSSYDVEIAGNGSSDRIAVTGLATVTGGQVAVGPIDPQTSYQNGQRYTIVTAAGGVTGAFASAATQSAFLNLTLDHQPSNVDLVIQVKDSSPGPRPPTTPPTVFGTVAQTRNQFATATALDTLPQVGGTLALYNSLLMLDAASARGAFDALSGEIHASAKTALMDESWLLRNAVNDRLRAAFGGIGAQPMATLDYGFTADLAPAASGPMPKLRSDRFAVWGQGYGAWGRTDSDRNAAKLTRSTGGFLLGADAAVFDTMRFGVMAGYSRSEFDVNARFSSGESDNYHLGLYGGGQWGALGLRTGASYTWHDIETRRTVAFSGFGDGLKADYDAGTAQLFGELGYRIDLGRFALEPFAGLAYVNLRTDGFSETGGAAALSSRSNDISLGYSTLGLRASTSLALQGMDLSLRGGLAWRHAFGDVHPNATLAFAGSNSFTVAGVPIAKDAAMVEAGLDLAIGQSASLGVSYAGQLAEDAQDHAFKGVLAVRF